MSRYNLLSLVLIYRILVANIHTLGTPLPKGLRSVCKLQTTEHLIPNCPQRRLKLTTTVTYRGIISSARDHVR